MKKPTIREELAEVILGHLVWSVRCKASAYQAAEQSARALGERVKELDGVILAAAKVVGYLRVGTKKMKREWSVKMDELATLFAAALPPPESENREAKK